MSLHCVSTITVGNDSVRIEVDTDNHGTIEETINTPWAELTGM